MPNFLEEGPENPLFSYILVKTDGNVVGSSFLDPTILRFSYIIA
jgi:hypothetical protein